MPDTHLVHGAPAAETVVKPWTHTDEQTAQIEKLREVCHFLFCEKDCLANNVFVLYWQVVFKGGAASRKR